MARFSASALVPGILGLALLGLTACSTPTTPTPAKHTEAPVVEPAKPLPPVAAPLGPTTPAPVPVAGEPVAPPPSTPPATVTTMVEPKPATIIGSEETSTMLDNLTVYVAAIDGKRVAAGRDGWSLSLPLKPGPHTLLVAFKRGVFTAETELRLVARTEASYELKFATDAQLFGKNTYCDFWIVEAGNNRQVVPTSRATLIKTDRDK